MKTNVKGLYGYKGYPNASKIEDFKADIFGSYITPKTITPVASTYQFGCTGSVKTATNAADCGIQGGYFKAQNTADTAGVQLVGIAGRVAIAGDVLDAYGIQVHTTVAAGTHSAGTANVCAASFKNTFTGNITATTNVLLLTVEGAGAVTGEKNMICMDPTVAVTNGIMVYNTANLTSFIYFSSVAGCLGAADVAGKETPSDGGMGADAHLTISVGGTPYYIPLYNSLTA